MSILVALALILTMWTTPVFSSITEVSAIANKTISIDLDYAITGYDEDDLETNLAAVLRRGFLAFHYDHPEIISLYRFEFDWYTEYSDGYEVSAYNITLTATESYTGACKQYASFNNAVNAAYNKIKKSLPKNAYREVQLYAIQNYVCKKIAYSHSGGDRKQEAVPAFLSPYKGVCESYARSFKVLCDKFGIPCILVSGDTYDKGSKSKGSSGKVIGTNRKRHTNFFTKDPTLQKSAYNGHLNCNMPKTKFTKSMWSGNKIVCKWKKKTSKYDASHITGYQVRYSTKRNMKKSKIKTIKGYKKSGVKFKLAKKYRWLQVRTYKKYGGFTICGQYSISLWCYT